MIKSNSLLEIVDNSGAQIILAIGLGGTRRRYAKVGDLISATVKKAKPNYPFSKKEVVHALIIATKNRYFRKENNTWISFSRNCAVLVKTDEKKKNYKPIGTRILIPLMWEINQEKFKEIISIASERI